MTSFIIQLCLIALSFFINVYILFHFCDHMFERIYTSRLLYVGSFLTAWLFITLVNLLSPHVSVFNLLIHPLVLIGTGILLYGATNASDILSMFLLILFLILIEIIVQFGSALLFQTPLSISAGNYIQDIITFSCYQMMMLFISRHRKPFHVSGHILMLIIMPAGSLYLLYALMMLMDIAPSSGAVFLTLTCSALIFIMNLMVYFLFQRISTLHQEKEAYKMLEQQKQFQYRYLKDLEQKHESSRKLFHDMKNHLYTLEQLYQSDSAPASAYAADLTEKLDALSTPLTQSRVLNILFHDRLSLAAAHHISFDINCEELDLSFIADIDLTTIMSNLLDNAFEECMSNDLPDNKIQVNIYQINCFIILYIANTCRSAPAKKKHHMGLGLQNVQDTVRKYGGSVTISHDSGLFSCQITFSGQNIEL